MYKHEKEHLQAQVEKEDVVLEELEREYEAALKQIDEKIKILQSDELTQSRIYQLQYQQALKGQVTGILEKLHADEYSTIQQYLSDSYSEGFLRAMYSFHKQGVPIILPIDKKAAVKAVLTDSKIKGSLYEALGINVDAMKKSIRQEITRGIASGLSWTDMARNLRLATKAPLANVKLIVRTEGHRIQQASTDDARQGAKAKGADVVKQWDATLDGDTRKTHQQLDGQIRETDEPFEIGTKKAMYPGDFGDPGEDCNCRCTALTRARWALDEDELEEIKARAKSFGLDKNEAFEDFKGKYLKAAEKVQEEVKAVKFVPAKSKDEAEEVAYRQFNVHANYTTYNLDVANAVNETMHNVRQIFGEKALDELHFIGTFPPGYSTRYKGVYVTAPNKPSVHGSLWLRNVRNKNAFEHMQSIAQEQYTQGYWSTPDAMHTIRHEIGHAIHRALETDAKNHKLTELRKGIQNERLKRSRSGDRNHAYSDWLSEYGFTNTGEFVAESVAEYLAGNPRETAKKVAEILMGGD